MRGTVNVARPDSRPVNSAEYENESIGIKKPRRAYEVTLSFVQNNKSNGLQSDLKSCLTAAIQG